MSLRTSAFLHSCLRHAVRWSFTLLVLAALAYAIFVSVRFHHVDTKLYAWLRSSTPHATPPSAAGRSLEGYTMEMKTVEVAGIRRNLSGLAFDADAGQLIAVVNRPATLFRLTLDGQVQSTHRLLNASDVEGVAYLGNGRIAVVEEGKSRIAFAHLPEPGDNGPMDLQRAFTLHLALGKPEHEGLLAGNKGFEGIGYDIQRDHLYVVKEHSPRALYRISGLGRQERDSSTGVSIEDLSHWVSDESVGTDLSSVEVDPTNGHLLLLSDESQSLVELDAQGRPVGRAALSSWLALDESVPQAEGVAIGTDGAIYIVSEPNLFYRLRPPARIAAAQK